MKSQADVVDALRVALKERDRLRRENQWLHSSATEPIAIVGMACRFPGGTGSPQQLWQLLAAGRDGISLFPADRGWDLERLYHPDPDHPGTSYVREGGFVEAPGEFDAEFFGIGPREALATDPQQRLLLEASWEALEDAGIDPASLRGTQTGVFAGTNSQDYGFGAMLGTGSDRGELEGYLATGTTASVLSGRVSYALGLEGAAMTVDTACSSSLVTLHLAAQALRGGECSLALAGGVTVLATPTAFAVFSRQRGLSPDGRCKAFADSADGVAWGEGVGMLVLERLSDAERNGHPVLATVKGSAVNQDGASNGLTAPNGPSQERVIRQALANARLQAKDIDAVEAHGTGTTLGDPIEAGALLATYGQERDNGPLKLGSIKSNIGHTQAAAGVAGVIKMVLAMREGVLPKTLHVDAPSSKVDWEAGEIELLTEAEEWESNGRPRRAGVSSFGISGTNAHVILEEAPEQKAEAEEKGEPALRGPVLLPLSAKSEPALEEAAARLASHLEDNPEFDPTDVSFSLATTRAAFKERAVAIGEDRDELLASLATLAQGETSARAITASAKEAKLTYLFTGQGAQRLGMGRELYEASPVFAESFDCSCDLLSQELGTSLVEIVFAKETKKASERLTHTTYAQASLFAIEIALSELLASLGLKPDLLAGHSIGEIAAAQVAGVLSIEDATKLVASRATLMGALPEGGAMLAVAAAEELANAYLQGKESEISLAAVNSPSSCVLSGTEAAIEAAQAHFEEQGRKTKRLQVSHAFHSPLMEPMLEEFAKVAESLEYDEPRTPIVSSQSGKPLEPAKATDPAYWVAQVREPVRFAQALATLRAQGAGAYLEIGPEPALSAMAAETFTSEGNPPALIATLREGHPEAETIAAAIAGAHANGAKLDWSAYFKGTGAKRVPLPTYPFQRERFWLAGGGGTGDVGAAGLSDAEHPLLGAAIESPAGEELTLTGRLSLATHPWLADHAVGGTAILPGTAFLELALHAAERCELAEVSELTLQAPLAIPEQGAVQLQVTVAEPSEDGARQIDVYSRPQGGEDSEPWAHHATGSLVSGASEAPEPLATWPPEGAEPIDTEDLYQRFADLGFEYGPAFQGLNAAWQGGEDTYLEVSLSQDQAKDAGAFVAHPALLDSVLHGLGLSALASKAEGKPYMPFSWSGVSVAATGAGELRARLSPQGAEGASLDLYDPDGAPVAKVGALALREVDISGLGSRPAQGLLVPSFEEVELPEAEEAEQPATVCRIPPAKAKGPAQAARKSAAFALEKLQEHLAEEGGARLAFLTENAIAAGEGESPDPAQAAVWGLLRCAQLEHPDRFALIDSDGSEASEALLPQALGCEQEPQLLLREGKSLAPRLSRAPAQEGGEGGLDPDKTVLITGATGGLGAPIARRLVERHGARHLLLASRSGEKSEGAKELGAELEALGAQATIAACDVSEKEQLAELLAQIPTEHPLGAVIHCAGALDDATIESQDEERLAHVFAPKADAAWHLHELTRGAELSHFVLFSSLAATIGNPGQANYASANAFLDALAAQRKSEGLPATAIAWGLWRSGGMASDLGEADLARMERSGIAALSDEHGLELFDAALATDRPQSVAAGLNPAPLRAMAQAGVLPPILSGLFRVPARRRAASGSLAAKLATAPEGEREGIVLEVVRAEIATVLGHSSAAAVPAEEPFKDLGFDSLAAVELRNRLVAASGLTLPATLVFDYPTPAKLAAYLLAETTATGAARKVAVKAQATDEPIAIVGMSCRYPGGVASPEELWQLLAKARDGIAPFPSDRGWDLERLYDPDPDSPLTSYVREGGFLEGPGEFDAGFFGIGPREALATDPQQRLLLEACWEALEDAGIDPGSLQGGQAGVFAGIMHHDYGVGGLPPAELEGYLGTGLAGSVASGRIAYELGLEGPAMTVDTACSSSLVTLHLAAQALRQGECNLALAGGATVLATPLVFTEFSRQRGLPQDGRSKSFADSADGVAWGEGVGMLVLERLSDAERNGHPVLAVLKGSAVNQDGASNGLTAPNGPSQERVIRQALANARLQPKDIDAVEAHGTGTTLGDPIEAGALLATYGQDRDNGPLKLGSIKSNIGHTQAAAGVAGVIKMVLAMREGLLPKTLHVDAPSSKVDWDSGEVELLTEAREWEPNGRPRRAGVSSFGISGTNAHVILEEAPEPKAEAEGKGEPTLRGPVLLPLSAKSEPALEEAAARLASHLKDNPELDPTDVSFSLATTRAAFKERAVAIGEDRDELLASLATLAKDQTSAKAISAQAQAGKLAYLFTGQGAQRLGMGRELYEASPVFAESFDRSCDLLSQELGTSLVEIVFAKETKKAKERLTHTTYAQASLFALEVALFELLSSRGLKPDLLAGHSIGEIAAAHVSGVLSIEDATKLVAARAKLMGELPKGGAMLAVAATEEEANAYLQGKEAEISLAAVNSPTSCVLSGEKEAIEQAQAHFEEQGAKTKRLEVSHAFHSHLMEPMLEEFAKVAKTLTFQEPRIPIVSTQSGEPLGEKATDPAYWVAQVREPVRFADALESLKKQGAGAYMEIGPDPALSAMASEAFANEERPSALIATLREGQPEAESIAAAIAQAHANGAKLDWSAHFKGTGAKRVPLPTYPFQRERFWLASMAGAGDVGAAGLSDAEHPLLGAAVQIAQAEGERLLMTGRISLATHPWLADHAVAGTTILPGAAFLELALHAAERVDCAEVAELTLQAPLVLPEQGAVQLQVTVAEPEEEGSRAIEIYSRPEASSEEEAAAWTSHATGSLASDTSGAPEPLPSWPPEGAEPLDADDLYERLAGVGLEYGPAFQGLHAAWREGETIYAEVALAEAQGSGAQSFGLHPALLDSALHGIALAALAEGDPGQAGLPFSWSGVSLHAAGAAEVRAQISPDEEGRTSLSLFDPSGAAVAQVGSLALREVDPSQLQGSSRPGEGLFGLDWIELELPESSEGSEAEIFELAPAGSEDSAQAAREAATAALQRAQRWLAREDQEPARLAFLTRGAVATGEEAPDPAAAAVWGLVRCAQLERPGAFVLVDTDGTDASKAALQAALAIADEPQLALREGVALAPRMVRPSGAAADAEEQTQPLDPQATTLITGGTGGIGALIARHLAERHGAGHLLLLSRSGERAEGAKELQSELEELGAQTTIAACDVSDREQLAAAIGAIPAEHPLGAVIHSAGALADGTIDSQDEERIAHVFAPKVDAAWNLHELTKEADLSRFVLFSSAAATLGSPGQANYGAANAFLDALAAKRSAEGLPATAIAWGLWADVGEMTSNLTEADLARMERAGIGTLSAERGLALFDRALGFQRPLAVGVQVHPAPLRAMAQAGALPPILRGLVRVPARRKAASGSLATKLATAPEPEREKLALELIRAEVATVLGHSSPSAIPAEEPFKDLGFDSLAAVELRNRLVAGTGLALPATLVFDYPTPAKLAAYVLGELGESESGTAALDAGFDRLESLLAAVSADDPKRSRFSTRLHALAVGFNGHSQLEAQDRVAERIEAASDEELRRFIDEQVDSTEREAQ